MLIEVTQDDIDNGQRFCAGDCPISLSLNRTVRSHGLTPEYITVRQSGVVMLIEESRRVYMFPCPRPAAQFISNFDGGCPVEPQTFSFRFSPTAVRRLLPK